MVKRSKDRTEPWVGFNGPVRFCILLPDIQCVYFKTVMFSAAIIVRSQK
jgi:hypothetical protein